MLRKIIIFLIAGIALALASMGFLGWKYVYKPNVNMDVENVSFYIRSTDNFESVQSRLDSLNIIEDVKTFQWVSKKMNLPNHIYPGRYIISNEMNNRDLIKLLRSGRQTPVEITFNNIRTRAQLAGRLSEQIELDSTVIAERLFNSGYANKFGFNLENFACMFIPNTYEVYWDISADQLFDRFNNEYHRFWAKSKREKAEALGLSINEVSILASIVEKETSIVEEYPIIAGVYLNRLKRGMPLQADPTIVFAIGDFTIKRVLHKHLEVESPYNTYKNAGLPPGPICIPSIQAINSVLNKKSHDYLYFCAKDDFSGKHVFAKTLRQHNQNARMYRKALNKRKIYN